MCKAIITKWFGRFGNNIMQISHCCTCAFEDNNAYKIIFPKHDYLKVTEIINNDMTACTCDKIIKKGEFFYKDRSNILLSTWKERSHIVEKYILQIVKPEFTINSDSVLYDCCVHIRSGDIANVNINRKYVNLPLEYYVSNIDLMLLKNQRVHIVFEDNIISVYTLLVNKYSNNKLVSYSCNGTIYEDFNTIMRCKYLITSVGTFSLAAVCMSNTIEEVYLPSRRKTMEYPEFNDEYMRNNKTKLIFK